MKESSQQITSPLLYRLIDEQPELRHEQNSHKYINLKLLQQDIRNNLEMILNTRLGYFSAQNGRKDANKEIGRSILNYGIADFSQQYYTLQHHQKQLCESIKLAIEHFEPRLQQLRVKLLENDGDISRSFLIRIEGLINIRPEPAPAVFESSLDVVHYQFSFEEEEQ